MANEKIIEARVKNRIGTEAEWLANDPVILEGEIAMTTDTNGNVSMKIGTEDGKKYSEYGSNIFASSPFVTPQQFGAKADGVTDDSQAIIDALSSTLSDILVFPAGEYIVKSRIDIPQGKTLIGTRGKSIIQMDIPGSVDKFLFVIAEDDVVIRGLTIRGTNPNTTMSGVIPMPAPGIIDNLDDAINKNGIGYEYGIAISAAERIVIDECEISNFTAYGLRALVSGKNFDFGIKVTSCFFHDNYLCLEANSEAEYSIYSNNSFTCSQLGAYIYSGNNIFTGNHFDKNRVGFTLGNGLNDAHGSISSCSFNHNALYGFIGNQITAGEAIDSCLFWYGHIYLNNCRGININGGQIAASNVYLDGYNGGENKISNVMFHAAGIFKNYNSSISNTRLSGNFYLMGTDNHDINDSPTLDYLLGFGDVLMSPLRFGGENGGVQFFQVGTDITALRSNTYNIASSGNKNDIIDYVYGDNSYSVYTNGVKRFEIKGNGQAVLEAAPSESKSIIRVEDLLVQNSDSSAPSLSTLNSTYGSNIIGFRVHYSNTSVSKIYTKVGANSWVSQDVSVVS